MFAYLVSFYIFDLYDIHSRFTAGSYLARLLIAVAVGSSLTAMLSYLSVRYQLPRTVFCFERRYQRPLPLFLAHHVLFILYPVPKDRNIVIVGAGRSGKTVYEMLSKSLSNGFRIVGFLDDNRKR